MYVRVIKPGYTSVRPSIGLIDHLKGKPNTANGAVDINGDTLLDTIHGNVIYGLMRFEKPKINIHPFHVNPGRTFLQTLLRRFKYIYKHLGELNLNAVTCSLGRSYEIESFTGYQECNHINELRDRIPESDGFKRKIVIKLLDAIEAVAKLVPVYIAQPPSKSSINILTIAKGAIPVGASEFKDFYTERQSLIASNEKLERGIHTIFPVEKGFSFCTSTDPVFVGENNLIDYRTYKYTGKKLSDLTASNEDIEKLSRNLSLIKRYDNSTGLLYFNEVTNRDLAGWLHEKMEIAKMKDYLERELGGVLFTKEQYLRAVELSDDNDLESNREYFRVLSKFGTHFTYDLQFAFRVSQGCDPIVYFQPSFDLGSGGISYIHGSSFAAPLFAVKNL